MPNLGEDVYETLSSVCRLCSGQYMLKRSYKDVLVLRTMLWALLSLADALERAHRLLGQRGCVPSFSVPARRELPDFPASPAR